MSKDEYSYKKSAPARFNSAQGHCAYSLAQIKMQSYYSRSFPLCQAYNYAYVIYDHKLFLEIFYKANKKAAATLNECGIDAYFPIKDNLVINITLR